MAVVLAELLKLIFALVMLPPEAGPTAWSRDVRPSSACTAPVAACLPCRQPFIPCRTGSCRAPQRLRVDSELQFRFEALRYISPPQYQLLNNMKLFTTSIVFRVARSPSVSFGQ